MANWEAERRLDYIEDRLIVEGRVNRVDVMTKFGTSKPQTATDLARYCEQNPRVVYDYSAKCYRWKDGAKRDPVRGSTPARRKAWTVF